MNDDEVRKEIEEMFEQYSNTIGIMDFKNLSIRLSNDIYKIPKQLSIEETKILKLLPQKLKRKYKLLKLLQKL